MLTLSLYKFIMLLLSVNLLTYLIFMHLVEGLV